MTTIESGAHDEETTPRDPDPEIRFALAMNGGVSLAVWIGGVCDELLRLVRAGETVDLDLEDPADDWDVYQLVVWAADLKPGVDVMAGASAGGLNAIFLALGLLYGHANLTALRDLWIGSASFDELLRDPLDAAPPSLLRGDDYFLTELESALMRLMPHDRQPASDALPIDAMLTVTSMEGRTSTFPNDFGDPILERKHDMLVRLRHPGADGRRSDFDPQDVDAVGDETADETYRRVVRRLARACRSTASFPGAFEPSRIRVCDADAIKPSDAADTLLRHQGVGLPNDGYYIDGGTLVNLPVREALDAVFEQSATGAVRRVFAMVVPDPSLGSEAEVVSEPPSLATVIGSALSTLPRNQTVGAFLTELQQRNNQLNALRSARVALCAVTFTRLRTQANLLLPAYCACRASISMSALRQHLERELERLEVPQKVADKWRNELKSIQPPWQPKSLTWSAEEAARWGDSTVRRSAARVLHLMSESNLDLSSRKQVQTLVFDSLKLLQTMASTHGRNMFKSVDLRTEPTEDTWQVLIQQWISNNPQDAFEKLGAAIKIVRPDLQDGITFLLALEVIENTFRDFETSVEQLVETVRIDSIAASPLDDGDARGTATGKIAGVQLGHFGSFLRASWRGNDWMWGRLDGSSDLIDIMLFDADPTKLATLACKLRKVGDQPADDSPGAIKARLKERWHARIVLEETKAIGDAIKVDREAGGYTPHTLRNLEATWLQVEKESAATGDLSKPPGLATDRAVDAARRLLQANRIGSETLADHAGSDQLTKTSLTALATGSTVLHRGGPRLLRSSIATIRYVALLAWGLLKGASSGPIGRTITGIAFGAGAATVAVSLFTDASSSVVFPIGLALFTAGLLLAYARAPFIAVPLTLLVAVPLALRELPDKPRSWWPSDWTWPALTSRWDWLVYAGFVLMVLAIGVTRRPAWMRSMMLRSRRSERLLVDIVRNGDESTPEIERVHRRFRWLFGVLALALPGLKIAQVLVEPDWFGSEYRQVFLAVVVLVASGLALRRGDPFGKIQHFLGRWGRAIGVVPLASADLMVESRGVSSAPVVGFRWLRFFLAFLSVAFGLFAVGSEFDNWWRWLLLGVASALAVMVVVLEIIRYRRAVRTPLGPDGIDRALLWATLPLVASLVATAVTLGATEQTSMLTFGDLGTWHDIAGLVLVTALGEELIFRGALLTIAYRALSARSAQALTAVSFGLWHIGDAISNAPAHDDWTQVLVRVAAIVVVTTLGGLVFTFLRHRTRSLAGPWLGHVATNLPGIML